MRTVVMLSLLVGCSNTSLKDERFPTGSASIAASARKDTVYAVNVDEGTVSRIDHDSGAVAAVRVGSEPTRIARVGEELWVTLRGDRKVAVLKDQGGELRKAGSFPVGAEPYGIVATEDGSRVYVAVSLDDVVLEVDGRTREVLRTFGVQDEPRWLALHPSGRALFVGSARNGTFSRIDLQSGEVEELGLPEVTRDTLDGVVPLDPRVTGDPSVLPDGSGVGVPVLYVDDETPVEQADPERPEGGGYGSSGLGVSRMNPALVLVDVDEDDGDPTMVAPRAQFLATMPANGEMMEAPAADGSFGGPSIYRSYPSSATAAPDSRSFLVTMEASNVVLVVGLQPAGGFGGDVDVATAASPGFADTGGMRFEPFTQPTTAGFVDLPRHPITTGGGPRGVAFLDDDLPVVHAFLDRTVQDLGPGELKRLVDELDRDGFAGARILPERTTAIAEPSLDPDVEAGRRLFYSATDARMASAGAGVSCSTCHFEGRNDALTWTLDGEPRQTPSLAGPVSQTAPVTWSSEVPSVADEAMITSQTRMGGGGLSTVEARQIEAFVASTRYPDVPRAGEDSELVRLGREVFERAEVGCASCHSGELFTDNGSHVVIGALPTQTPTLRGIAASPPYLHDGSAADLRAVVAMARNGAMGDTSSLTDHEVDALVAYLESL